MPLLFAGVLFLNALLLFWVQPLFAKLVLPVLGGSPSVWTTCMLFFQAALLAGYAYSHAGLQWLGIRRQAVLHAAVVWLPLLIRPFDVGAAGTSAASDAPVSWLLRIMSSSIGLPFVVLASTAPLLQRWFSVARRDGADPYWLYAASNAGSLVALLAFPMLFEPLLPLGQQTAIWRIVYAGVALLLTTCAVVVIRRGEGSTHAVVESATNRADAPTLRARVRWLALSFAPSSLMLGVTTYLSTDVAAVPLLWVLPLSCYLLTFIIAFGGNPDATASALRRSLAPALLPLLIIVVMELPVRLWIAIPIHLIAFSALALLCHAELARHRPGVRYLTEFYLWLAVGGVLGGVFNTIVAPQIFTSVAEYPIAIAVASLLCVSGEQLRRLIDEPRRLMWPVLATMIALALVLGERLALVTRAPTVLLLSVPILMSSFVARDVARFAVAVAGLLGALAIGNAVLPSGGGHVLHAERTFFGVYRVRTDPAGRLISLMHGTTTHGRQIVGHTDPEPLTYYYRGSPIGQVFAARAEEIRSVGVIGLGAGTLAAYARPGASWVFYEIDGAVERIARDVRFFHYLDRCGAECTVVLGDARLSLAQHQGTFDVLVLDAFSSDAIPLHLLSTEALDTYSSRLAPRGWLAFHISNRHIRLRPVIARLARAAGLRAFAQFDDNADTARGYESSEWVVMARDVASLQPLTRTGRWAALMADERAAWTDDFSNIWTELR